MASPRHAVPPEDRTKSLARVKALVRWAIRVKVNRSPTQTKPYNIPPLELNGFTGQRVTNTWLHFC